MGEKTRWGILSTGRIAGIFATGLKTMPDADLIAVGSRTRASADEFAEKFGIPQRHASYKALVEDPDVDVIYVASPHAFHKENSLLCLRSGKAVLCEKPFTINAAEAEAVIRYARERNLFVMEAMWTRFLPAMGKLRQLVTEGAIGEARMVVADFGFRAVFNPKNRLFDPYLGGGGLLDVGIYPISLASMIFGAPTQVTGLAHLGETGVDEQSAAVLGYAGGRLALVYSATRVNTPKEAVVLGTEGQIRIHAPWWRAAKLTVSVPGKDDVVMDMPWESNGYAFEAAEVMSCLREGKTESTIMPLAETLSNMKVMDQLRAQWGLRYPQE